MARFPRLQPNDNFITESRCAARPAQWARLHVNVVDDARIVRHNVEKLSRLLQGADDRIVRSFEDTDDAARGKITPAASACVGRIPRNARDDAIAIHGGAGVFRRDEDVALVVAFFPNEKGKARLVHVQLASDKISRCGKDVAILADARDLASAFEVAQRLLERAAAVALQPERTGELLFVERAIFRRPHQCENFVV